MYSKKGLNVMDHSVYIEPRKQITDRSFDMNKIGNLLKICEGENIGTVVNIYRMVRLFDSLISDNTKI
jgi:uridylate kinase